MKHWKIALIPGDGIGPEVVAEGVKVLKKLRSWIPVYPFRLRSSHGDASIIWIMER